MMHLLLLGKQLVDPATAGSKLGDCADKLADFLAPVQLCFPYLSLDHLVLLLGGRRKVHIRVLLLQELQLIADVKNVSSQIDTFAPPRQNAPDPVALY